jgi:hypothetical protein
MRPALGGAAGSAPLLAAVGSSAHGNGADAISCSLLKIAAERAGDSDYDASSDEAGKQITDPTAKPNSQLATAAPMMPSTMFITSPIWLFMNCSASQPAIPPMMMAAIQPIWCSSIRGMAEGDPLADDQNEQAQPEASQEPADEIWWQNYLSQVNKSIVAAEQHLEVPAGTISSIPSG